MISNIIEPVNEILNKYKDFKTKKLIILNNTMIINHKIHNN